MTNKNQLQLFIFEFFQLPPEFSIELTIFMNPHSSSQAEMQKMEKQLQRMFVEIIGDCFKSIDPEIQSHDSKVAHTAKILLLLYFGRFSTQVSKNLFNLAKQKRNGLITREDMEYVVKQIMPQFGSGSQNVPVNESVNSMEQTEIFSLLQNFRNSKLQDCQ